MKIKTLSLLLCLIAVTSSVLISCSEDLGFGNKIEQDETNIVSVAKQIYQNQGSSVCLPNPKANKNNASRSSFSYLAELDPLWNEAFTYNQGTDTVVVVPLNCGDDIRSTLSIIEGDETTYQFAKVFSRMIVKPSEGENGIYVLSYMPESNYASSYPNLEAEMGYNPTEVDFTGLIVSSTLNGVAIRSFLYNEGALIHTFVPYNEAEGVTTEHEHATHDIMLQQELQLANESRSNVHQIGSESENICDNCLQWKWYCTCPPEDDPTEDFKTPCPNCGVSDGDCGCSQCPTCGRYFCICNKPTPPPVPDFPCEVCGFNPCKCCKTCKKYPCECPTPCDSCGVLRDSCICVTNYTPILYVPHERDFMLSKGMDECVENRTCSAFAALETACSIYESSVTQNELYTYYTYLYNMTPEESFVLDTNSDFMVDLFMFSTTQNIKSTIEYGMPVIVRFGNCYITVVGIQYDGDIIYANHDNGNLYAVEKDYFNNYENIVIEGVPQELPNPYLLNQ